MTPERRSTVERVCFAALETAGPDRAAFLDAACRDDPDLRRQVESLLAGQSDAARLLEAPVWVEATAPLAPGARLGPYEILAPIGAGGMGQVYKARDTRLDRTVAIKTLPPALVVDPERRARFEREAKAIAGLAHPSICTLYDVGEQPSGGGGPTTLYLVMEHLAGETLAARLQRGPLPLAQALAVAADIADALSAAHRQGVIHRDLKPGNVMLARAGGDRQSALQARLLDFGLAKLKGQDPRPAAEPLPQQADPSLTSAGRIIGTLNYMAPEQLEGKPADTRTDVWALGVLLYEMIAGKRAFEGSSTADLAAAILDREPPPLSTVAPATPVALERLILQCVAKAPDDRPDTAHDVASELRRVAQPDRVGSGVAGGAASPGVRRASWRALAWGLLFVAGGLALAAIRLWPERQPAALVVRSALRVDPAQELNAGGASPASLPTPGGSLTALAWTPDGTTLVFVGRRAGLQQIYVRRLDSTEARPLPNTEHAQAPAVSPDGRYVAFWADRAIRSVPIAGGPVTEIVPGVPLPPCGLAWDAEGRLFLGRNGRIWMIPAGGAPRRITTIADGQELGQTLPFPLPGGRALLYTARNGLSPWSVDEVVALTLATGERKRLLSHAADARYLSTGHLVFLRHGVLYAVPFDPERLEVRGPEVPVLDGVAQALTAGNPDDVTRAGHFAVSTTGTLAWVAAPLTTYGQGQLVAVDLEGVVTPLAAPVSQYGSGVRVSPDGRRLGVSVSTQMGTGLWVYDFASGASRPLPVDGEADWPVWTPDGKQLVFAWLRQGTRSLATLAADGATPPQDLAPFATPSSFARDGRLATVFYRPAPNDREGPDVALLTIQGGRATGELWLHSPYAERWPTFSPRGDWLAYGSNLSGRDEIYVQPYPGHGGAVAVTVDGGTSPAWHPNGRQFFYLGTPNPDGRRHMMTVTFEPGTPPRTGRPVPLFEFNPNELTIACDFSVRCYDVAPDGRRFYAVKRSVPPTPPTVTEINLVQHWFEELKAKAPAAR